VGEAEAVAVLTDLEQIARSVHVVVDTDGSVAVRGSRSGGRPRNAYSTREGDLGWPTAGTTNWPLTVGVSSS
jgi:hypothetical protein